MESDNSASLARLARSQPHASPVDQVAAKAGGEGTDLPLYHYLAVLIRNRFLIGALTLVVAIVALTLVLLEPQEYTAESTFSPETGAAGAGRLTGLATQLGVPMGGGAAGESLDFYVSLVTSRSLHRDVVTSEYEFTTSEGEVVRGTLPEILGAEAATEEGRVRFALSYLKDHVEVEGNAAAGLVRVKTTTEWPALSELVNRRILALVNEFNLNKRRTRASAQREFIEGRLEEARRNFAEAQDRLQNFLTANRRYQEVPQLTLEASRYEQDISLRRQLLVTLAEAYEQARMDEIRDMPVVTVVDAPERSARREPRRLVLTAVMGAFVGFLLSVGIVLARDFLREQRVRYPTDYAEFAAAREAALGRISRRRVGHVESK